jgi:hypothetical protein
LIAGTILSFKGGEYALFAAFWGGEWVINRQTETKEGRRGAATASGRIGA